jgi:Glycosyl transferase family 2
MEMHSDMVGDVEEIGPDYDHLTPKEINFTCPEVTATPTKKAAVVAVMRNEGGTITEWIAHYRAIGFDTIFIYTNDNTDGSDRILESLHKSGEIVLRNNVVPDGSSVQYKAYRHAVGYCPLVRDHEWVAIVDADEFLFPTLNGDICSASIYLDHIRSAYGASSISLNWKWFSGDKKLDPTEGMLLERFRQSNWNRHWKTISRIADIKDPNPHHAILRRGCLAIDGSGKPLDIFGKVGPEVGRLGQVNHYWNRSFREYHLKRNRGRPSNRELRDYANFFEWWQQGTFDPLPTERHLEAVRHEMRRIRQIPGVRQAELVVLSAQDELMRRSEVDLIYHELLAKYGHR